MREKKKKTDVGEARIEHKYLTERVKSPGLLLLGRARKLPWTPRVNRSCCASIPVMLGWNHLRKKKKKAKCSCCHALSRECIYTFSFCILMLRWRWWNRNKIVNSLKNQLSFWTYNTAKWYMFLYSWQYSSTVKMGKLCLNTNKSEANHWTRNWSCSTSAKVTWIPIIPIIKSSRA